MHTLPLRARECLPAPENESVRGRARRGGRAGGAVAQLPIVQLNSTHAERIKAFARH